MLDPAMKINQKAAPMRNPLIVALDVDSRDLALKLADDLESIVGGFKIGPRLCLRYGQEIIREVAKRAPVFIDNKHFDIPSTMESAIRASFELGASLATVHALSGREALTQLANLELELNQVRPFKILCVTILTSWDQLSYPPIIQNQPVAKNVESLAEFAVECGIKNLVCSPHELDLFSLRNDLYLVTPGIRFGIDSKGDQKRVLGPAEALEKGASAIVVGRPIIEAKNPKASATDFLMAVYEKRK